MELKWENGFEIKVASAQGEAVVSANRAGLRSLAAQLTALADGAPGDHIHYDAFNALAEDSAALIIELIP